MGDVAAFWPASVLGALSPLAGVGTSPRTARAFAFSAMNYYRHYLGDYQRDTAHLSLIEHGAYRCLLDAYYANDGPIPADERALFRLARAMDDEIGRAHV